MDILSTKRIVFAAILMMALGCDQMILGAPNEPQLDREYPIKVGFVYNFMKFTHWPTELVEDHNNSNTSDSNEPMTIGIIGEDPFGKSFDVLKKKLVRGRKIVLRRFQGFEAVQQSSERLEAIQKCHVLFIGSSKEEEVRHIIDLVEDHAVLTIGETKGFIESGGIINFIQEKKKVRFEVNIIAAKHSKLQISSKLLALARRIIKEESAEETEK
jgi:hypothetical protein